MCPSGKQVQNYWVNDGPKAVFIAVYVVINLALIGERSYYYFVGDGKKFTDAIGYGIPVARGTAAALRFNTVFILIPVLRNFLSWLRGTWVGTHLPIDKNIIFHQNIGWAVCFLGAVHGAAHCINFYRIAETVPTTVLAELGIIEPGTDPLTTWEFLFTKLAGATGVAMTIVLFLMVTTAVKSVSGQEFELFWFTHHLFIVLYICASLHGFGRLLEEPQFVYWLILPGLAYIIERSVRVYRGSKKTIVLQAIQHPSRVLELQLQKPSFKYKAGQYVYLQCPYVADYEWHPFTISSSSDEGFIGVHMRIVGDWTGKVYNMMNPGQKLGLVQSHLVTAPNGKPVFLIDGPFGAASEEFEHYDTLMMWCAGIGVTPFASILKDIKFQVEQGQANFKSVDFYWINRDKQSFEWIIELLAYLEQKCPYMEINLFFTGSLDANQVRAFMMEDDSDSDSSVVQVVGDRSKPKDAITGLQARTTFGRPDFSSIFSAKAQQYQGRKVGVFYCGPAAVSKILYENCAKHTSVASSTIFKYHKENF
eukprot:TRINITY_DN2434_c0_g1_i1.p1 TRINITY_DN2434_c0_g1~~TRINITY_DN2434_c0_g1_i1.p1  ORF type:complete len:535 (-),score=75.71 TRINITY_DN2434_c0_g1_i1:129-1733(-)